MLIFPTYQTLLTKTAAGSSGIVTDNLRLSYDFSDTDCWNGNTSGNIADYTVNNLAGDHNDAIFRDYVGSAYATTSDSSYIALSTAGGGALWSKGYPSSSASRRGPQLMLPGAASDSYTTVPTYNLPTVAASDTDNLFNGVGNGDWTWETWWKNTEHASLYGTKSSYPFWLVIQTTAGANRSFPVCTARTSASSNSAAGQFQFSRWDGSSWTYGPEVDFTTGQQSGWTNWTHIVLSRQGTGSSDIKVYVNDSLEGTMTGEDNISHLEYAYIGGRGGNGSLDSVTGIVRMYKGKALTASEVTTNWNAEKARFGY